jgi:hypothetical protein
MLVSGVWLLDTRYWVLVYGPQITQIAQMVKQIKLLSY